MTRDESANDDAIPARAKDSQIESTQVANACSIDQRFAVLPLPSSPRCCSNSSTVMMMMMMLFICMRRQNPREDSQGANELQTSIRDRPLTLLRSHASSINITETSTRKLFPLNSRASVLTQGIGKARTCRRRFVIRSGIVTNDQLTRRDSNSLVPVCVRVCMQ